MGWLYLTVAILFEVAGTTALKLSDGMTKLWPSAGVVVGYGIAFTLLALALRTVEVGIAYAVWAAAGTAIIAVLGILVFGESASALKLVGLALIVAGVVALNAAGGAH